MYQLYSLPGSCSMGIHVLLNKLKVPVEIVGRNDVENYRQLVPSNQVPALKTTDNLLTEGAAIALYLMAEHGQQARLQDQEFIRWLMFNYATLHPAYSKLFGVNASMPEGEAKQALLQVFADRAAQLWQIVDRHLQGRQFMQGDEVSIIDYLLAVYVRWGNVFPAVSIPIGDNVLVLVDRVSRLPEFQQALQHEGVTYSVPANALAA